MRSKRYTRARKNTSAYGDATRLRVGLPTVGFCGATTAYVDCVVVSGSYIGPEQVGSLAVSSPNGGESWTQGTTHAVTWSSTGSTGAYVKIELLKAGVLNSVISSSTENDGALDWVIPAVQTLGTDYTIRITSTSDASITDSSNAYFSITSGTTNTITVTAPNGGESWAPGTLHSITWTSTGSTGAYVKIDLMKAGVFKRVISTSTANDGVQPWLIPTTETIGSDYAIRITSTTDTAITDTSDAYFSIGSGATPTLTLTSPNGGESWIQGTTHAITWTSTGSPGAYVKIELLKAGVLASMLAITENDGSYSWDIPPAQITGTDYTIMVTSITYPTIADSSDAYFTITSGTTNAITVTSPNGGESWAQGTLHSITWTSTGSTGAYVKIELLKAGVLNKVIVWSTANDGAQSWLIPAAQAIGSDYTIRITSTSDATITDSSDAYFTIAS